MGGIDSEGTVNPPIMTRAPQLRYGISPYAGTYLRRAADHARFALAPSRDVGTMAVRALATSRSTAKLCVPPSRAS
jgi:hypothetical protein